MKLWLCLIAVFLAGCEKPIVQKSVQPLAPPPSVVVDPNQLRLWVDFQEVRNKTIAEIRAMNIGCFYIIKPEMRQEMMELAFEIHLKVTGKPYLATIIEYWMTAQPVGIIGDRGNQLLIPTCEDNWQYGDLNADGRVDMLDLAIYAAHSGVPPLGRRSKHTGPLSMLGHRLSGPNFSTSSILWIHFFDIMMIGYGECNTNTTLKGFITGVSISPYPFL